MKTHMKFIRCITIIMFPKMLKSVHGILKIDFLPPDSGDSENDIKSKFNGCFVALIRLQNKIQITTNKFVWKNGEKKSESCKT